MSKQFYADHIYVLEEDADESCTRGDFPKGTIVAVDHLGDWFKWSLGNIFTRPRLTEEWPPREKGKGIQLYRDYWSHIAPAKGSPYRDAFDAAKKRKIK